MFGSFGLEQDLDISDGDGAAVAHKLHCQHLTEGLQVA